jgi:hypothetical protein
VKLQRGISAASIEDPVLKDMYITHLKEQRVFGVELSPTQMKYLEEVDDERVQKQRDEQLFNSFSKARARSHKLKPLNPKGLNTEFNFYLLFRSLCTFRYVEQN